MKKRVGIIVISLFVLFGVCGCNNGISSIKSNKVRDNVLGTWSYTYYDDYEEENVTVELEITKDEVTVEDESYEYEVNGNWIFLKDTDTEIVLYIVDDENIVAVEGLHLTK